VHLITLVLNRFFVQEIMNRGEFKEWLEEQPAIWKQVKDSAANIPPNVLGDSDQLEDDVVVALMYPVVSFVLREIGLPWNSDARRYADLWRSKYRRWIDEQSEELELHPYAVEAAGTELRRQLEVTLDTDIRSSWEQLSSLLR
jgi:hypothetical protein